MALFRHKVTGEQFTAETFSISETGVVFLQRLRIDGRLILGGDAEIDVLFSAEPVDDAAKRMLKGAQDMAEDDKAQS